MGDQKAGNRYGYLPLLGSLSLLTQMNDMCLNSQTFNENIH